MMNNEITKVEDYINIIKKLTDNQKEVVEEQIRRIESLGENRYQSDNLSTNYYEVIAREKWKNFEEMQSWESFSSGNKDITAASCKFYYRGHYKSTFELLPSVFRDHYWKREDYFYHEMMVHCPQHFQFDSHLDKLVTMQHYDCPTRLLDVTSNPLVALYFACKNYGCKTCDKTNEGEVLIFPVLTRDVVYSDSDRALMLSCIPRFTAEDKKKLWNLAQARLGFHGFAKKRGGSWQYADSVVERFYYEITTEVPSFKREIKPIDLLQPLFVQPNKTNGRILKQDGAFIINGLSCDEIEAKQKLESLTYTRIKIKNQPAILNELNSLGIHEASLFPEVDRAARYLKECID